MFSDNGAEQLLQCGPVDAVMEAEDTGHREPAGVSVLVEAVPARQQRNRFALGRTVHRIRCAAHVLIYQFGQARDGTPAQDLANIDPYSILGQNRGRELAREQGMAAEGLERVVDTHHGCSEYLREKHGHRTLCRCLGLTPFRDGPAVGCR
ncbi:Uncharacterised protein [Mycobacteroides abscessus subsp. abscessus]|nr:Uncharacterised protein [Mycobacteroides abscessus subsp. abscessus]